MAGILKRDKARARKSALSRLRFVALALALMLLALVASAAAMVILGIWVPGRAWLT